MDYDSVLYSRSSNGYEIPAQVAGVDRWKYFQRPTGAFGLEFFGSAVSKNLGIVAGIMKSDARDSTIARKASQEFVRKTRTIGTQSLYRESEAQTEPFSPDVNTEGLSKIEVDILSKLTWGNGLPATQFELDWIERAKERAQLEIKLEDADGADNVEKLRKTLQMIEWRDWKARNEQITMLLQENIKSFEEKWNSNTALRLKHFEDRFDRIANKQAKKLESLKEKVESEKRRIRKRLGMKSDFMNTVICNISEPKLQTFSKLIRQMPTPAKSKTSEIRAETPFDYEPSVDSKLDSSFKRVDVDALSKELDLLTNIKRVQSSAANKRDFIHSRLVQKRPEEIPRPVTPVAEGIFISPEEEDKISAAVKLQRFIRGIVAQDTLEKNTTKYGDLVHELDHRRGADSLKSLENLSSSIADLNSSASQTSSTTTEHMRNVDKIVEAAIEAPYVGMMVDYLHKDLKRLREVNKIRASMILAERRRRELEAEELGKREQEVIRRAEENKIFAEIMNIHGETIDTYLEAIIADASENVSTVEAKARASETVKKRENNSLEDGSTDESIVSELMSEHFKLALKNNEAAKKEEMKKKAIVKAVADALHQAKK